MDYKVIGLMSGTSLDGVDIVFCTFRLANNKWSFRIKKAETYTYNKQWQHRLKTIHTVDAQTLAATDAELGVYFGKLIKEFITKHKLKPQLISSHGHTVFHQPHNGFTTQIGSGAHIAAITLVETVCDFRSKDVALGGQGAPLVPVGDKLLFGNYDFCLNLGGIANISFEKNKKRIAFDICPVNMALNQLAAEAGKAFDKGGAIAAEGTINAALLKKLNALAFYRTSPPKSIGKEWYLKYVNGLISDKKISLPDRMRTVVEHIAVQIVNELENSANKKSLLVTGGGAHHTFLMQCLKEKAGSKIKIIIPGRELVNFKEALIFALLGVLRVRNEINVLRSVTGAKQNNTGGTIYSAR